MHKSMRICIMMLLYCYFAPGRGAKCCDECVCLSVDRLHISKTTHPKFTKIKFSVRVTRADAWSSSDDSTIRYALPLSYITSCFPGWRMVFAVST